MADLDDDLGSDIMAAINGTETETAATEPAASPGKPVAETEKPSAGKDRDEQGRFKAKAEEAAKAVTEDKPKTTVPQAVQGSDTTVPDVPKEADIPAPMNWKGSAKVNWQRLPREVRQAIIEDYSGHTKASSELDEYRSALGDRAQFLAAQYGSVGTGLKSILAGADMANKNPAEFIRWLAQRTGLDLGSLVQGGMQSGQDQFAQGQSAQSYQPSAVERELADLKQTLNGFLQQQHQTQTQTLKSQVDAFASDPSHPYFNDVRSDMAILVKEGKAKNLDEAYDMAVWANPETRKAMLENERKRSDQDDAKRVDAAKKAGGSLRGVPGGQKPSDASSGETLEDTLRREMSARLVA
jgi:hypothetical protein